MSGGESFHFVDMIFQCTTDAGLCCKDENGNDCWFAKKCCAPMNWGKYQRGDRIRIATKQWLIDKYGLTTADDTKAPDGNKAAPDKFDGDVPF